MGIKQKTVFISYRRTNFWTALAIFQNLTANGYDVFFDYKSIPSGDFAQVIDENIKSRAHFLIVLSPSALERCQEPGDWLRREIKTAIDCKRNIIPLMMEGFDFGSAATTKVLTGKLSAIKSYNGLSIPAEYFEEAMAKLRSDRFLNRLLESVQHPISDTTKTVTKTQISAASKVGPIDAEQLTAEEWFERGYVYSSAKNFEEAIRCYSKAIELRPEFSTAVNSRGVARRKMGDLEGALQDFDEALRLNPKAPDFWNDRGTTRLTMGNSEGALQDFDEALRLSPKDPDFLTNRGLARQEKSDLNDAFQDFDEALRLRPVDPIILYNHGNARKKMGDLEGALQDYQKVIQIRPDDILARVAFMSMLQKLGSNIEANEQKKFVRDSITKLDEYNQACFECLCGNTEKALDLLKIGLDKKHATKEWAKQDPDFESIRDDPRFIALVEE